MTEHRLVVRLERPEPLNNEYEVWVDGLPEDLRSPGYRSGPVGRVYVGSNSPNFSWTAVAYGHPNRKLYGSDTLDAVKSWFRDLYESAVTTGPSDSA